jgi:hypothetical protein
LAVRRAAGEVADEVVPPEEEQEVVAVEAEVRKFQHNLPKRQAA